MCMSISEDVYVNENMCGSVKLRVLVWEISQKLEIWNEDPNVFTKSNDKGICLWMKMCICGYECEWKYVCMKIWMKWYVYEFWESVNENLYECEWECVCESVNVNIYMNISEIVYVSENMYISVRMWVLICMRDNPKVMNFKCAT